MSKHKNRALGTKSFCKTLGSLGLFTFMIILGFVAFSLFSPIVSSNAETENTAKVSTPAGTVSLATEDNVTINITPTPTQKIYSKTTALKITNSCKKGATITLSTNKTHNNLERQGADSFTKTIASVSGGGGTLTDNSWGYTLDNTTYSPVPTKDQSPATIYNTTSATASTTTPETLNLTYAVKTDDTIPSGTYTNDLVYTVNVKPECLQYTLKFNLDNGTGKPGATYTDRQLSYGTKVNLADFTPTRTDYEFMGWIATTNNPAATPVTFAGNLNTDVNPTNETEVTLKAKWKYVKGIYSIASMQQMNPNICKANTTPNRTATTLDTDGSHHGDPNYVPTKTLVDTRDNNTYTVSKLADGKCWMTQNLRIIDKTITPADSNVTANYTIPASSINGFNAYNTNNAYLDSIHGGYYTWTTATAGTGTTALSANGHNTTVSICPKGWRLPTSGASGEFQALYNNYNSSYSIMSAPAKFSLSGATYNNSYFEGEGSYWSSTVSSIYKAYYLGLTTSDVNPSRDDHGYMLNGFSVRCIADDKLSLDNIANMQDMTPEICAKAQTHQTATLRDTRDGNTYTVAKLRDGKCWMTQNLRIINKTLTPADSDVTSNYTIPASSLNGGAPYDTSRAYLDNAYGGYYIWYTATAGTGTTAMDMRGLNTISSICPKGWRLPTGGNGGEFNILYNNYGTSILYAPFNFTLHGDTMFVGAVGGAGTNGAYWSSTTDVTILSNNLYLSYGIYINVSDNRYLPANGFSRGYGHAVRCIAR